jgi:hypothetical protein
MLQASHHKTLFPQRALFFTKQKIPREKSQSLICVPHGSKRVSIEHCSAFLSIKALKIAFHLYKVVESLQDSGR